MTIDILDDQRVRVRVKTGIEVELILNDGTRIAGSVFIGKEERVQDILNHPNPFFPLRQKNQEILLVAKSAVAVCKPLDSPG